MYSSKNNNDSAILFPVELAKETAEDTAEYTFCVELLKDNMKYKKDSLFRLQYMGP